MRYALGSGLGEHMKAAILANVALCVCPPVVATSVALAVPSARHAVHRITAPSHHHATKRPSTRPPCPPAKRLTSAAALPVEADALAVIPSPRDGEAAPAVSVRPEGDSLSSPVTPASPGGAAYYPWVFPVGPGPIIGTPPGPPISPVAPVTQPAGVPEPASWVMMLGGFWGVGVLCRQRSRGKGKLSKLASGAAMTTELLSSGALVPSQAATIAGAKASSALGAPLALAIAKKAAVCVCSGAILATAVTTVPPLKRAVFAATAPAPALMSNNCEPGN